MKKLFFITMLFIGISYSCSKDESVENKSANNIDYFTLNKSVDNQISTLRTLTLNSNVEENYLKYFKTKPKSLNVNKSIPQEEIIKITLAPHYNHEESQFMLNFYQDLANCYDNKIIELLNSKRILLNNNSLSSDFKNEANFIFNTIEKTTNEIGTILNKSQTNKTGKGAGFGDCFATKGKSIGRAVATGALVGAAGGALAGAAGGTVALPGIGTATGAVGGAVFGAAKGAVSGGLVELTWAFIDCATERTTLEAEYIYFDDFYMEIIAPNDPDQFNFYIFENSDNLINTVLSTSDETLIRFIE
ncbi:glycine zipper family protein [Flavobacterium sp. 3-218]